MVVHKYVFNKYFTTVGIYITYSSWDKEISLRKHVLQNVLLQQLFVTAIIINY